MYIPKFVQFTEFSKATTNKDYCDNRSVVGEFLIVE